MMSMMRRFIHSSETRNIDHDAQSHLPFASRRLSGKGEMAPHRPGSLGFRALRWHTGLAQEAARPDGALGAGPLAWLLLFLPALIIIFFLIPLMRRQKRYSTQVNRSLEISEETLQLARERVALIKQTNELLKQLVEKQSRF